MKTDESGVLYRWRYEQIHLKPGAIREMKSLLAKGRWASAVGNVQLDHSPYTVDMVCRKDNQAEVMAMSSMLQSILVQGADFALIVLEQAHKGGWIELTSCVCGQLRDVVLEEASRLLGSPQLAESLSAPGARIDLSLTSPYIRSGEETVLRIPAIIIYQNMLYYGRAAAGALLN